MMTTEAQNALLKMLEEPPAGTVLVLTVNHAQTVLPTIRSRAQIGERRQTGKAGAGRLLRRAGFRRARL